MPSEDKKQKKKETAEITGKIESTSKIHLKLGEIKAKTVHEVEIQIPRHVPWEDKKFFAPKYRPLADMSPLLL
jgi:hypothetical protein